MTRFRDVKVCNNLVTNEVDDHKLHYKCTIGLQCLEGKNSTFRIAHAWWNRGTLTREVRSSLVCFVSQVLVVVIAHHIVTRVSFVRVISWSSHDERISTTVSPPFLSTSSFSHSSLISCISSPSLRAAVTLRTSPKKEKKSKDESYFNTERIEHVFTGAREEAAGSGNLSPSRDTAKGDLHLGETSMRRLIRSQVEEEMRQKWVKVVARSFILGI